MRTTAWAPRLEPPSPFGRSLSRRVQYHSASAPVGIGDPCKQQRPDDTGERPYRSGRGLDDHGARICLRATSRLLGDPGEHQLGRPSPDMLSGRPDVPPGRFAAPQRSGRTPTLAGLRRMSYRGARIRTGDLCDPNAALYRTEPRPGLLVLSNYGRGGMDLRRSFGASSVIPETPSSHSQRTGWD